MLQPFLHKWGRPARLLPERWGQMPSGLETASPGSTGRCPLLLGLDPSVCGHVTCDATAPRPSEAFHILAYW